MAEKVSHSMVRVLPNRHALGLAAVLLAMAYAGASQSNGAAYLLCFVLGAVAAISSVHAWSNVRGVVLTVEPVSPVFAGEPLRVSVALASSLHRDHFSITLGQGRRTEWAKVERVPLTGEAREEVPIPTEHRGRIEEFSIIVESIFPLGFFTARKVVTVRQPHFVYPSPAGTIPLPKSDTPSTDLQGGLRVAGDDFGGVRPWLPGESQRHIDWKAASRGQPLLTKQWAGENDEILHLDWADLAPIETEIRLSQLARWVISAEEGGAQYELRLPDETIPPSRGDGHFHACLRALACFENPEAGNSTKDAAS